jgi:hypothetical protein
MTPKRYQAALEQLELHYSDVARLFDVEPRSHRRWISGKVPVPQSVALVLSLMIQHRVSVDTALALLEPKKPKRKRRRVGDAAPF